MRPTTLKKPPAEDALFESRPRMESARINLTAEIAFSGSILSPWTPFRSRSAPERPCRATTTVSQ